MLKKSPIMEVIGVVVIIALLTGCEWFTNPTSDSTDSTSEWHEVESPTTKDLYSVFALSENNAWAVGEAGVIIHWNGSDWSTVESPTEAHLSSIYFVSPNDGWAVGGCSYNRSGTILHYDGNSWHKVESPTSEGLYSVYFPSSEEGWAVGGCGISGGIILHYHDGRWSEVESPTPIPLSDCYFLSPNNGWVVGGDLGVGVVVLYYNGTEWSIVADLHDLGLQDPGWTLASVYFTSPSEGWVVGSSCTISFPASRIFRYDGESWSLTVKASARTFLGSLDFSSPTNGYAVGDKMLHYDGSEWHDVGLDDVYLRSVYLLNDNEGWAVGGRIFHLSPEGR
ncbi:hypothetical protein KAX02_01840 [candidate division WOR-3 bacterium]|nr:hypothetical protein [candidate division WOR-3 bacterium]